MTAAAQNPFWVLIGTRFTDQKAVVCDSHWSPFLVFTQIPAKPMNQYTSLQIIGTKQILCGHWFCLKTSLGCSGLVHGDDPEGWDGEGGGRGGSRRGKHVNPWLIHVNVWQKPLQYCKVISLQLIKIIGGKKKTTSLGPGYQVKLQATYQSKIH